MGKLDYTSYQSQSQESNGKTNTVTLSCRLDKTLYDLVQGDAKKKGISLNSLINSIVKGYVSWERYAAEIGFIPLAKDTVRLMFENLDDKKLQKIAQRLGRTIPKELILLMFNKIDFDSILSFIELTSARYGMVQHTNSGANHEMLVYHDVNERFSTFLGEVLKAMAEELSFKSEVLDAGAKILRVRIEENSMDKE